MTNEEYEKANAEARKLIEVARNKSSIDWFRVVDEYYEQVLPNRITELERKIK